MRYSIALGGGSIVTRSESGRVVVGPKSVGEKIVNQALVFGGSTLTTTDVAVALGSNFGDKTRIEDLDKAIIEETSAKIGSMIELAADAMKTTSEVSRAEESATFGVSHRT